MQIDKYVQREILVHCQLNHPCASLFLVYAITRYLLYMSVHL